MFDQCRPGTVKQGIVGAVTAEAQMAMPAAAGWQQEQPHCQQKRKKS